MSYQSFNEAWDALPKPHQNNARSIIRSWINRFNWSKGDFWRVKIERVLGVDIDWTDTDYGESPAEKILEE